VNSHQRSTDTETKGNQVPRKRERGESGQAEWLNARQTNQQSGLKMECGACDEWSSRRVDEDDDGGGSVVLSVLLFSHSAHY